MSNYQNSAKQHENSQKNASHQESVGNILDNVENVPFALRGSQVKTILYFLFSFIAAAELTAALSFYTMSMGLSLVLAAVFCGLIAFGFHALLHGILSDTAKGVVFSKRKESGAMSNEVTGNIILSIVLLAIAACSVFFIGKKGFTAYRATQFEKKQDESKPKGDQAKGIDASMLTNKSGKIAAWKLEALTDLEKAKAKGVEATTAAITADRESYDATTAQITDIVGASAFLIELLLALLAYSIATAKLAAVMDEIARRNGASRPTSQQAAQQSTAQRDQTQQSAPTTATNTPSVTPTNTPQAASQQAAQTATATEPKSEKTGVTKRFNEYDIRDQDLITEHLKKDLEGDMFYFSVEQIKAYLSRVNGLITIVSDATTVNIRLHSPILTDEILTAVTPPIEPQTTTPTTRKAIGFSDNKATNTGNEGRVIIKGFQRENKEKQNVNEVVTICRDDISSNDPKPETSNDISSDIPEGFAVCPMCDELFEKKNYRHTFCTEKCRVANWEATNGKKLRRVKA